MAESLWNSRVTVTGHLRGGVGRAEHSGVAGGHRPEGGLQGCGELQRSPDGRRFAVRCGADSAASLAGSSVTLPTRFAPSA